MYHLDGYTLVTAFSQLHEVGGGGEGEQAKKSSKISHPFPPLPLSSFAPLFLPHPLPRGVRHLFSTFKWKRSNAKLACIFLVFCNETPERNRNFFSNFLTVF